MIMGLEEQGLSHNTSYVHVKSECCVVYDNSICVVFDTVLLHSFCKCLQSSTHHSPCAKSASHTMDCYQVSRGALTLLS